MLTGSALRGAASVSQQDSHLNYDYVKAIIKIAHKNGWDIEPLGIVPKDVHAHEQVKLTKKQVSERDRIVKNVLQRFSKILTPPVPLDLERSILEKDAANRLPWEEEVIRKTVSWRRDIARIRPEIIKELDRAI